MSEKPSNPKDLIGSNKLPLDLWPASATAEGCLAFLEGALKYGRGNYRVVGVRASIYAAAAVRHINEWLEGADFDEESGLPQLGKALACLAILVDAKAAGALNDDRPVEAGYAAHVKELTPHVGRLRTLHAGKDPRHYTIADNKPTWAIIHTAPQCLVPDCVVCKYGNNPHT